MFNPSGIKSPKGDQLRVERARRGLYYIDNAYEGEYEYFKDRPIHNRVSEKQTEQESKDSNSQDTSQK